MTSLPEEEKSLGWDLDEVLTELKFGRYQMTNLILIGLMIMYTNLYPLSFTLTTADLDYRCLVPECENAQNAIYNATWVANAIPFKDDNPYKCKRYEPLNTSIMFDQTKNDNTCPANYFNKNITEDCNKWIYDTVENTIVKTFNITCENQQWKLSAVGTINNFGQFVGIPIFGVISDRFGRKSVAIMCCLLSAVFGVCRGLSTSYLMFCAFEFLDSFFGSAVYGTAFILGIELVNPKMRSFAATIIGIFYPMGAVFMGFVAWYYQDWRKLLIACYSPGILFLLYYWLIPESIRWLQMNGYYAEATAILKRISDSNDIELTDKVLEEQKESMKENTTDEPPIKQPFWKPLVTAIQSKYIFLRLLNCSFSWFTNTLVYYGLSINSIVLSGNKYVNFILVNGVEVPAFFVSGFIMNKIDRRISQSIAFFLSGLMCIVCEFIPPDFDTLRLVLFLVSKFLITISFNIIYIYSAEMFPTELRLSLCGFASMFGRLGSMLAPQTIILRDVMGKHAPVLLFGVISIVAGGLSTSFPETKNKKLPDTMNQAKMVD